MTSKRGRVARLALAVVVGGLTLAGCGQAQPGVAASVDGEVLTVEQLQGYHEAFFADYPEAIGQAPPARLNQVLIQNWVRGQVVDKIARARGLEPSQGELEAFAVEQFQSMEAFTEAVSGAGIGSSETELVMAELRAIWIQNAVRDDVREELGLEVGESEDEVDAATQAANEEFFVASDIAVNPRYGSWEGELASVVDGLGSISVLDGEPAPGPAG